MTPNSDCILNAGNRYRHVHALSTRPDPIFLEVEGEQCVFMPLTKGKWTLISQSSYDLVKDRPWCMSGKYAGCRGDDGKIIRMHRLILGTPEGMETDHINGIRLDNRICNLRSATTSQNGFNKGIVSTNTSGAPGVVYLRDGGKYKAQIKVRKKNINLGYFVHFEDAVEARRRAEIEYFGEWRRS